MSARRTGHEPLPAAPRVLSIAGTDPTGGAGIQADLKSIAANRGYGMAAVTALVAQNTRGVDGIHVPPAAFLTQQLRAVSDDVEIDAVKIGMLFDRERIAAVHDWLRSERPPVVVLDPVMIATSGDRLLDADAEDALRQLLGEADLITPNRGELAALLGEPAAATWDAALAQARRLAAEHGVAVLAKGGHFDTPVALDALVAPTGAVEEFAAPRIRTRNTHGTGCSLSSAIATQRAHGLSWSASIAAAKRWLTESIEGADALAVGRGNGPISHFAGLWRSTPAPLPADAVADSWWRAIAPLREAVDALPFVRGLGDGTLGSGEFAWYLAQDALYLRDYARVLARASALAPSAEEQSFWALGAHGAIAAELELHARWLPVDALFDARPAPATVAYMDHLLALSARGDYDELIAGVLPCYWMYQDIGERMLPLAHDGHPYADWLRTYGDPAFHASTERAIRIVTERAAMAAPASRTRMLAAFETSARHEHAFFAAPSGLALQFAQAARVDSRP